MRTALKLGKQLVTAVLQRSMWEGFNWYKELVKRGKV